MSKNILVYLVFSLFFGAALGGGAAYMMTVSGVQPGFENSEPEPLYWTSPMDPTYRSDSPGTSPMGMELVPVYAEGQGSNRSSGVVSISPAIENNLGVRTGLAEEGPFKSTIRTVGYVQFDEDRLVHIHPRVAGWIEQLHANTEGSTVEKGQPIYSIYSPELVNAQEELLIALQRGNSLLEQSSEERLLALQVPPRLIEQLKSERKVFRNVTIYAPQRGVVSELNVREGQYVQPGNPILSIGVLDEIWVIAEVFERQVALVEEGDSVTMTLEYLPGREWEGVVDYIYPTLDPATRTIPVRLRFENPDETLKPNMFAEVVIRHSDEGEQTLVVPHAAVIRTGNQDRVVLAMGNGRFKSVAVVLGRLGDESVEILEGLQAGDRVVTSAHFLLDSESSISSDFQRMSMPDESRSENMAEQSAN